MRAGRSLALGCASIAALALALPTACSDSGDASADAGTDAPVVQPCAALPGPVVETVGPLSVGRYAPSVAAIAPGKILVAGGDDFTKGLASSAELVEPMSSKFAATGGLEVARNWSGVALVDATHVLVAGGNAGASSGAVSVAELYDVAAAKFARTGNLGEAREGHTLTTLKDGRVLAVGGLQSKDGTHSATAEAFDPKAGTFAPIASKMSTPRAFHAAGTDSAGTTAFFAGGATATDKETATIEIFDVGKSTFSVGPTTLAHPARALAAARLPNGQWLVTGGSNATDKTLADAQTYDPATGNVTKVAPMGTRRSGHTLTVLADGRILAIGGYSDSMTPAKATNVMEVFDPATSTWEQLPVGLASPRLAHAAVLLPDCRVAVIGGEYAEDGKSPFATYDVELVTVPFIKR